MVSKQSGMMFYGLIFGAVAILIANNHFGARALLEILVWGADSGTVMQRECAAPPVRAWGAHSDGNLPVWHGRAGDDVFPWMKSMRKQWKEVIKKPYSIISYCPIFVP